MAEADRCFSEERNRLLEEAEAAAAVAATQVQTIEELRAQEAGTRREFEKARQEPKKRERIETDEFGKISFDRLEKAPER